MPDPLASGGGVHFGCDGADSATLLSDEPQLLAVNLVRSNGFSAHKGHYLVEMLPQPNLLFAEEHLVASGRQVLPMVGSADLELGNLLGVAHAFLMRTPIDIFQRTDSIPAFSSSTDVSGVEAVSEPPLTATEATASLSPALLERLTPELRVSFLRVGGCLPTNLRHMAFDLHGPEWFPVAIEQLGDVLCDFSDVFFQIQTRFWLLLFDAFRDFGTGGQRTCHLPAPSHQPDLGHKGRRHSQSLPRCRSDPTFGFAALEPSGSRPKEDLAVFGSLLSTRSSTTSAESASCPSGVWTRSWTLWAKDGCFVASASCRCFIR